MKKESLDMLLVDRALGELSPEVAELLEEYFATHPNAAVSAHEVEEVLDRVREFAQRDMAPRTEALPRHKWREVLRSAQVRIWFPRVVGLAACLVVGVLIGGLTSQSPHKLSDGQGIPLIQESGEESRAAEPAAGGLWSKARLAKESLREPEARPARHRLFWDPRSQQPRVEEIQ